MFSSDLDWIAFFEEEYCIWLKYIFLDWVWFALISRYIKYYSQYFCIVERISCKSQRLYWDLPVILKRNNAVQVWHQHIFYFVWLISLKTWLVYSVCICVLFRFKWKCQDYQYAVHSFEMSEKERKRKNRILSFLGCAAKGVEKNGSRDPWMTLLRQGIFRSRAASSKLRRRDEEEWEGKGKAKRRRLVLFNSLAEARRRPIRRAFYSSTRGRAAVISTKSILRAKPSTPRRRASPTSSCRFSTKSARRVCKSSQADYSLEEEEEEAQELVGVRAVRNLRRTPSSRRTSTTTSRRRRQPSSRTKRRRQNHGKLKCKHARLIMNFGNLLHAHDAPAEENLENWPTTFLQRDLRCAALRWHWL